MPRDAFGNPIDEPAGPALPGLPDGGPPRPPRRGPRLGAILALSTATLAITGVGLAVLLFVGGESTSTSTSASSATTTPAVETPRATAEALVPAPEPVPEEPATSFRRPPRGLQEGSMLRRDNFAFALREIRRKAKGRPRLLRVDAERVSIQTVLRDGRLRQAVATWKGEVLILGTSGPVGGVRSFAWTDIDRSAPQRLVRSATGRARVPAARFDYAALLNVVGLQWSAFVKTGDAFTATPGGTIRRQISG